MLFESSSRHYIKYIDDVQVERVPWVLSIYTAVVVIRIEGKKYRYEGGGNGTILRKSIGC